MNFLIQTFIKDLKIVLSYKLQFIFSLFSIVITLFTFYLISSLVGEGANNHLDQYENDYFKFLFLGIITAEITLIISTFPNKNIRNMQLTGVFEQLLASGRNEYLIILSTFLYPMFWLIFKIFIYFLAGFIFFDINIAYFNISYIEFLSLIFFIIGIVGVGCLSISATIFFKSSDFVSALYLSLSALLGGVAYPLSVLPESLRILSNLLPTTHFLEIIRINSYSNNFGNGNLNHLIMLIILSLTFFILGMLALKISLMLSKKNGSLLYY